MSDTAQTAEEEHLGFDRDAHHHILAHLALAGQAIPFFTVLPAELFRDPAFHAAAFDDHPAFAAKAFSTAGGIYVHPGFQGGTDQDFIFGGFDLFFVRYEFDPGHEMFPLQAD